MEQFDVAHALYREEPVTVYYLSHDPVEAARAHCDFHVRRGVDAACTLLSAAWHTDHNPALQDIDAPETKVARLFQRCTPPAGTADRPRPLWKDFPDRMYKVYVGDGPCWLLGGQKIAPPAHEAHPSALWTRLLGGNYKWVHRLGLALAEEFEYRFGRKHPALPVLWTLEKLPPQLLDTADQQTEPEPVVPNPVVVDGFYDAVASYRLCYVTDKAPLLIWTRRAPPAWIHLVKGRYELSN